MGRGKVELKKIHNPISCQVTFSKRKVGLLKKASELSLLCDAEIALIIFSPTGKLHEFASHSMNRIIGKYQKFSASTGQYTELPENVETLRWEVEKLRNEMARLEKKHKLMIGEDLDSLSLKKLQHFEKQINLGVRRIHSKKVKISLEHIGSLKTKQRSLEEENANLVKKLSRSHIDITEAATDELEITHAETHEQDVHQTSLNLSL